MRTSALADEATEIVPGAAAVQRRRTSRRLGDHDRPHGHGRERRSAVARRGTPEIWAPRCPAAHSPATGARNTWRLPIVACHSGNAQRFHHLEHDRQTGAPPRSGIGRCSAGGLTARYGEPITAGRRWWCRGGLRAGVLGLSFVGARPTSAALTVSAPSPYWPPETYLHRSERECTFPYWSSIQVLWPASRTGSAGHANRGSCTLEVPQP